MVSLLFRSMQKIAKNVKIYYDYNLLNHQHRNIIQTKLAEVIFFYPRSEGYKKCALNKSAYMKNKVISSFFYSELT